MKTFKKVLMSTSVGLLLGLGTTQAHAFLFNIGGYSGAVDIKFDLYTAECATTPGNATPNSPCYGGNNSGGAAIGPSGGTLNETTYGVAHITDFETTSSNILWAAGQNGEQILAVVYGIADKSITSPDSGTTFNIENVGCTGGGFCDGKIHLDFYKIASTDYSGIGAGGITSADRLGFSTFGGVTNLASSELLGKLEFTSGARGTLPGVDLFQNTNSATLPASGSGNFLADCVSGPMCTGSGGAPNFNTNAEANASDFSGQFTLRQATNGGGWGGRSFDPLSTNALPEPSILSLFSGGLLGLGFGRRFAKRRG